MVIYHVGKYNMRFFLYRINSFFRIIGFRIKHFFTFGLIYFLLENGFHVLSVVFAAVGIVATLEKVTWLMIVGTLVALFARLFGYMIEVTEEEFFGDIPVFLKSTLILLIVTAIGMFPIHFLLHTGYGNSFLLSLNGFILLFYALAIIYAMMSRLRSISYKMKIDRKFRREERKKKKRARYDEDEDEEL